MPISLPVPDRSLPLSLPVSDRSLPLSLPVPDRSLPLSLTSCCSRKAAETIYAMQRGLTRSCL